MKFSNILEIKTAIRGLDFLHINDGNDDNQEIEVLNIFFLDERNTDNFINFIDLEMELNKFSNLCFRKMHNSLDDYTKNINLLILENRIELDNLVQIKEELEYFKKHVETSFVITLSEENLNRYYQIFQARIFFTVNFFIRETKKIIEKIRKANAVKFDIFKQESSYYKFERYIKVYLQIDNFHAEYSFLYRKLVENKIIEKINHKDFADYLLTLNLINQTQYSIFLDKRNWLTLKKALTLDRETNYNKIFFEID